MNIYLKPTTVTTLSASFCKQFQAGMTLLEQSNYYIPYRGKLWGVQTLAN